MIYNFSSVPSVSDKSGQFFQSAKDFLTKIIKKKSFGQMFTGTYGMGLMGGLMQTVQTLGNNIGNMVAPLAEDEEEQITRMIQGSIFVI